MRGGKPAVSRDLRVRWPVIGAEEREAALQVLDSGVLCGSRAPQAFLPYEGDDMLDVIVSKAFLLAEDAKITDPVIVQQILQRG